MQDYGIRGFKFHPTFQGFYANDRMAYPLYEAIEENGGIALPHRADRCRIGHARWQRDASEIQQSDVYG